MDYTDYIRFAGALLVVLALMGGLSLLLKRLGMGVNAPMNLGGKKRMSVKETLALDHRRRLFLVECDNRQHMILLGQNGETVIESSDVSRLSQVNDVEETNDKAA